MLLFLNYICIYCPVCMETMARVFNEPWEHFSSTLFPLKSRNVPRPLPKTKLKQWTPSIVQALAMTLTFYFSKGFTQLRFAKPFGGAVAECSCHYKNAIIHKHICTPTHSHSTTIALYQYCIILHDWDCTFSHPIKEWAAAAESISLRSSLDEWSSSQKGRKVSVLQSADIKDLNNQVIWPGNDSHSQTRWFPV